MEGSKKRFSSTGFAEKKQKDAAGKPAGRKDDGLAALVEKFRNSLDVDRKGGDGMVFGEEEAEELLSAKGGDGIITGSDLVPEGMSHQLLGEKKNVLVMNTREPGLVFLDGTGGVEVIDISTKKEGQNCAGRPKGDGRRRKIIDGRGDTADGAGLMRDSTTEKGTTDKVFGSKKLL